MFAVNVNNVHSGHIVWSKGNNTPSKCTTPPDHHCIKDTMDSSEEFIECGDMEDSPTTSSLSSSRSSPCLALPFSPVDDFSFVNFKDGYHNFSVSIEYGSQACKELSNFCEEWPMSSVTVDTLPNLFTFKIPAMDNLSCKRGWREQLRRASRTSLSCSLEKNSHLRVRGIVKCPSQMRRVGAGGRNRICNGLNETVLFSLSSSVPSSNNIVPSSSRSPLWMCATRRAWLRSRKNERRRNFSVDYKCRMGTSGTLLSTIREEPEQDEGVLKAINQLNQLNVLSRLHDFRESNYFENNTQLTQLTIENIGEDSIMGQHLNTPEEELCDRLWSLPVVEHDPDNMRALRESLQSFHVTHVKTEEAITQ